MTLKLIGQNHLPGAGKTMQLMTYGNYLYVGNMIPGIGVQILDVSNPKDPRLVGQLPAYKNTLCSKLQIADDLMIVNYENRNWGEAQRVGFSVFHLKDPKNPKELSYTPIPGQGVHRTWYSGKEPYVFVTAVPEGFNDRMLMIFDLKDPSQPVEISRWWLPGQWLAGGEKLNVPEGLKYKLHHAVVDGNRAYCGMWDGGLTTLDISDITHPRELSNINWSPQWGGHTHTGLPLPQRKLLVVTDEAKGLPGEESQKNVRILDLSDERNPKVLSQYSVSEENYRAYGPRFGPHNLHENRPGSYRSDSVIFVTWFGGGLRIVDITDPQKPKEIDQLIPSPAQGLPPTQMNDVFVTTEGLIYLTDRAGSGIYIAEWNP